MSTDSKHSAKIKFGVMCFSTTFPYWQAKCIESLLSLEGVELSLLIIDQGSSDFYSFTSRLKRIRWNQSFFQIYNNFIARPASSKQVDLSEKLNNVPQLRCDVIKKGKFSQYFKEEDISEIKKHNLDFILRFAFGIIRGEVLKSARFGVWSFHHDDEEKYRGGPPCFWEIFHSDRVTGTILQRLTNKLDGGIILKKGFLPTCLTSYAANLNNAFLESAYWPAQVCMDIQNGITDYIEAQPSKTDAPIYLSPTNLQMIRFAFKLIKNHIAQTYRSLFRHNQWNIGIIHQPIHTFLHQPKIPPAQWMPSPKKDQFFADPFAIQKDGITTILFEELDYKLNQGRIFYFQFEDDPSSSTPFPAMNFPHHASYPYLLPHVNEIYCIPETYERNEIALYRALEFPRKWEKAAVLVADIQAADSTVFQYENRWWLACTDQQDGPNHKLRLYYADNLFGPWQPHKNNPVKVDIRSSRPAGTPFYHVGSCYRPAQDCSEAYGSKIVINKITTLTPFEYHEETVAYIEADPQSPYPDGCHTICALGNRTIIDGRKVQFIKTEFFQVLKRGWAKIYKRKSSKEVNK